METKAMGKNELILTESAFGNGATVQARIDFHEVEVRGPVIVELSAELPELVVPWKCERARLVAVAILASGGPATIQADDAGEPFALRDGIPYLWHERGYSPLIFDGDVSALHVRTDGPGPVRLAILSAERAQVPTDAGGEDAGGATG
jgi:hypothetical protein